MSINITFDQLIEVIKKLSPSEKLKLNDVLWQDNIEIPEEHQRLVLDRVEKSRKNPSRMLDWDEASNKLTF